MKRIIAMALCLMLALGCAAAAEEAAQKEFSGELTVNNQFIIRWVAPENYEVTELRPDDGGFMILSLSPDEAHSDQPEMVVSIAPDELMADVKRLNDLDDAALAEIEATFRAEDEVEISYVETDYGTKLMMVKETRDGVDYVDFFTIYLGYDVEMVLFQNEAKAGTPLTEEQIATVIRFLSDMEFAPAEQD